MQYKRMSLAQWKDERAKAIGQTEAKGAKSPGQEPPSPKPVETGLTESQELDYLPRIVIPLTGHEKYGYVTAIHSPAEIKAARGLVASKPNLMGAYLIVSVRRPRPLVILLDVRQGSCGHGHAPPMQRAAVPRVGEQRKTPRLHLGRLTWLFSGWFLVVGWLVGWLSG
ncbi:hypothetical protein GGR56DRAFT_174047 [Xylariaceae sp. FL0804]|nr:hypothetical protein GGR56DRAFT_174047 [Xylariaceae sp. FL0804]